VSIPGKQGKRSYIADEIPNLNTTKYPLENNGTELGEYYLNVEICKKIAKHIRQMDPDIHVIEFYSNDKSISNSRSVTVDKNYQINKIYFQIFAELDNGDTLNYNYYILSEDL
jgi:hypothetical protein